MTRFYAELWWHPEPSKEPVPPCRTCEGTGEVEVPHPSPYEEYGTVYDACPRCGGPGRETAALSKER